MARSALLLLALALCFAAANAAKGPHLKLNLDATPVLPPDLVFNDSWTAKVAGTPAGDNYTPQTVDWASVIEAVRVICRHEMRICNWCTRAAFHDGGANSITLASGSKANHVVTVPPGAGGLDASLLLTPEQLRPENSYDSFSTFVAATVRILVGFYDISYADGLAVCGSVAREVLSAGEVPVYTLMPAIDRSNKAQPKIPFLVGRLDTTTQNGAGILPGPDFTVAQFADYFVNHFSRGVYDGVALLGSHTLLDNQECVKTDTGRFAGVERMFAWNSPDTYYKDLTTPKLEGPIPDLSESDFYRSDPPPLIQSLLEKEQCKFTSQAFKDAVAQSFAQGFSPPPGNEVSFDWLDPDTVFTGDPTSFSNAAQAAAASNGIDLLTKTPRPDGIRERRVCDSSGACFDGWPYTQNDGFLGVAAQDSSSSLDTYSKQVRKAVLAFRDSRQTWHDAYGNAFVRLLNYGVTWSPQTKKGQGLEIHGWECARYVSGAGDNADNNKRCDKKCGSGNGCPDLHMVAPLYCRCSSSPWGDVAMQRLFPNSTQTAIGGTILATPSGLQGTVGRKLLAGGGSGKGGSKKPRCPMEAIRDAGLLA